jgi:transcription elongation factor Elf1
MFLVNIVEFSDGFSMGKKKLTHETRAKTPISKPQKTYFTCEICGINQNVDQTVHIRKKLCVSCYTKEQVYATVQEKIALYILQLKEQKNYTQKRRNKVELMTQLNSILVPVNFFQLNDADTANTIVDVKTKAIKAAFNLIKDLFQMPMEKPDEMNAEWVASFGKFLKYKKILPKDQRATFRQALKPVLNGDNLDNEKTMEYFKELKKVLYIPAIGRKNGTSMMRHLLFGDLNDSAILKALPTYRKAILKASSQATQFKRFIRFVGQTCQFQTRDDKIRFAIEDYITQYCTGDEMNEFSRWFIQSVNDSETATLIPNISNFILQNYEHIFYTWYCKFLPFEKSRFLVDGAKAMSRTDFALHIIYQYSHSELKMIKQTLSDFTERVLKSKAQEQIDKIKKDEFIDENDKKDQIDQINTKLQQDLLPENLKKRQEEQMKLTTPSARFIVLNVEKAFNMILNKLIRYHYKRLKITTPVQYITNVSSGSFEEKKTSLTTSYWISSREW